MKKEDLKYPYFESINDTKYWVGDDGFWYMQHKITHLRSKDGIEWEKKEKFAKTIDKNLERAYKTVIGSMEREMKRLDYNLFNEDENDKAEGILNTESE